MGTNYYAHLNVCPHCERPGRVIHIGKSSHGWRFHFATNGGELRTVAQWREFLAQDDLNIVDEYGQYISFNDFWEMVGQKATSWRNSKGYAESEESKSDCWFRRAYEAGDYWDDEIAMFSNGKFS